MRFGSLFSGIGGLDLGLERAGMQCRWQVEIDDYCQRVLAKHWPDVPKFRDIRDCGKHNLEPVDLICGGFPCQPFSLAGKRAGQADDRYLWPEMLRVINEVKPAWVIGENVPGIIGMALDTVLADLEGEGYEATTIIFPACALGAWHQRSRVWILAHNATMQRITVKWYEPDGILQNDVPDADSNNGHRRPGDVQVGRLRNERTAQEDLSSWRTQWSVEPDVCGMAHGISEKLDGGLNASTGMGFGEDTQIGVEGFMREMWEKTVSRLTSHRWEQKEQFAKEFIYSLRLMPYKDSLGSWQAAVEKAQCYLYGMLQACETIGSLRNPSQPIFEAWQSLTEKEKDWASMAACGGVWINEWPSVQRVASGISSRVDRLKGLGNAVVPQCAEFIGRMILEWTTQQTKQ